jgi:hypothetical protein
MPEKDFAELQAASAALVGCLDRCAAEGIQAGFAQRLSLEVSAFYAAVARDVDAQADTLRAEDFDHFPPNRKSHE